MIVKSIDLANDLALICDVNPIKSEVSVVQSSKLPQVVIGMASALNTSYRILKKNTKVKSITSYIKGLLKIESVLDTDDILVRTTDLDGDLNLAVLTDNRYIEDVKRDHADISILDYEVTSILRLMEFCGVSAEKVLHFNRDYAVEIVFEGGLLKSIMVKDLTQITTDGYLLSGFIPEGVVGDFLNNPTGDPKYNVAFGGALYFLSDININFLQKESSEETLILFSLLALILAFLFVIASFGIKTIYLNKKIADIERLSKNEIKRLNITNIVDPLSQAKGVLAKFRDEEGKNILPVLDQVGSALSQVNSIVLHNIIVSYDEVTLDVDATNSNDLEEFRKRLSQKYNFVVQESSKDPKGITKAKIKGKR